jgi:peptidoglycan/xylan/chitin deacetylase (PgdA/CDA1 family)
VPARPLSVRRHLLKPVPVAVAIAALVMATVQVVLSTGASAADPLISAGKPATASSVGGSAYAAANAVDGNTATRWASVSHVDPQWLRVDLGATMNVSKVSLVWDVSCASAYQIQVSGDGSTFTTAYSTTTGDGATDDIALSASGRYIRMYGTVRCRDAGYSLQEFKVFGAAPSTGGSLISQHMPIKASSEGGSAYVAANAVDGSTSTRWASVSNVDPQWIRIDFGHTATISKVSLVWDLSCGKAYRLETSADDKTYTSVYSTSTGDGATDDITLSASGRYLRMFGTVRCRTGSFGYSLQEFRVYGLGVTSPPSPPTSPSPSPKPSPSPSGGPTDYSKIPHDEAVTNVITSKKEVALTLDDGPWPYGGPHTDQFLNLLKSKGATATFFVIGGQINWEPTTPGYVKGEDAVGEVANHTWTHPGLNALSPAQIQQEIVDTQNTVKATIGKTPTIMRPPYGLTNRDVNSQVRSLGVVPILWNIDPKDYNSPGVDVIYQRVVSAVAPGSIILMHDGGGDRSQSLAALAKIIDYLQSHGYATVTVDQLLKDGTPVTTGDSF